MYWRWARVAAALAAGAVFIGCSSSAGSPPQNGDAGPDLAAEATPAGAGLAGTVKDRNGTVVSGAKVAVGTASVFSDVQGKYALSGIAAGTATVMVTKDWFKPLESSVAVAAGPPTAHDITLDEIPLELDPADQALADSYGKTFDWTKQTVSVAVAARPTRRDFDNAVYFHNPALYRDTSKEPPLTPAPLPEIMGTTAKNFSFPLKAGNNAGQEALELGTIVDAIKDTPLGPTEPAEFMLWTPMTNWLAEWDAAKAADLKAAGLGVRQQSWGGNAVRPQEIEKVYLHAATGTLWAKVIFAGYVQLGAGINDDDGDGLKEVYGKILPLHYSSAVIDKLAMEYGKTTFNTHGLSKEVVKSLNELYSTTAAQIERFIGQPFELPGVGTFAYPFVVLRHSGMQKNVILVAP
jgi:carboxypeptidase family protein